jgi:peroxiredoxin
MEAYRDQYATMFHNGNKVILIGISADPDTMQSAWAREKNFPWAFGSDPDGKVARMYATFDEANRMDNRTLFIVGPDGKIAYVSRPFRVMAQESYTDMAAAIDRVSPPGANKP